MICSKTKVSKKGLTEKNPFEFISMDEFCKLTDLSKSYVYKLTSKNLLPIYKPFGKRIYFKVAEITELFEASRITTSAEHTSSAVNYVFNSKKGK